MTKTVEIAWANQPADHDYPAAASFLGLLYDDRVAEGYVDSLRRAAVTQFKAKDIFRASGVSLLGVSNSHVESDQHKIRARQPLSPLLLVRDPERCRLIIADGYHRLCAVYSFDEDAVVPCKICGPA